MIDYKNICLSVCELVRETGNFILKEKETLSNEGIEAKSSNNFVTYIDKASEERLVKGLKLLLPDSGFIAEEGTETYRSDKYNWIIDPIDGTTNFIHGFPPFAISIGLIEGETLVMGVIYEIVNQECFYAWKDSKAYLNGIEIKVSGRDTVAQSLIAIGFPYNAQNRMEGFFESLKYLYSRSHGFRRLGSAATDLAYVACGRCEAFFEYNLSPWDVAAGAFIVQQAGGRVSDFNFGNNYIFGREIIATNGYIHDEFSTIVHQFLANK